MSVDSLEIVRQYNVSGGPNYTDDPVVLGDTECAESDNVYWDGRLRTIPGGAQLISAAMNSDVVGLTQYFDVNATNYVLAVSDTGRISRRNGAAWTTIASTALPSSSYFQFMTYNNTLLICSGSTMKKWGGGAGTIRSVSGSPPNASLIVPHHDYILINDVDTPSQLRYNDGASGDVWDSGNVLNIGVGAGQIMGLINLGDNTVAFKRHKIYVIGGATPPDFTVTPTLSDVGSTSPNSICQTPLGVFFWSEAGPSLFTGYRTYLLSKRLKRILDTVDWDETSLLAVNAAYYPYRRQVLVSYPRTGQSGIPDRMLLLDLNTFLGDEKAPTVFWPILFGSRASARVNDTGTKRGRIYHGHADGHVTVWDSGTTWNGATITSRMRSKVFFPKRLDLVTGVRTQDFWFGGTTSRLAVKVSVNGGTFTAHGSSPFTLTGDSITNRVTHLLLSGTGSGANRVGRGVQTEWTLTGTTPVEMIGQEIGFEMLSPRRSVH